MFHRLLEQWRWHLLILLLACNKEEKFPTKNDLKGQWECLGGRCWLGKECVFEHESIRVIYSDGSSETWNYKLQVDSKTISFLSGSHEGQFFEIWINKKTWILNVENIGPVVDGDAIQYATYKKIE